MTTNQNYKSIWQDLVGVSFEQGWRTVNGIRTRYLSAGQASNPPLIFLHGIGGHAEAYVRNLGAHSKHFHVWSIDMLGHGWTDKPHRQLEIRDYVDHVLAFADSLGTDKIFLSGESLGGWVTAKFAAWYPDRAEKIVLNTMGGSQADPEVMNRLKTLSMQGVTNPEWEFIRARLEWLMKNNEMVHDDLIACRQRIYASEGMAESMANIMCLQDMDVRLRNLITDEEYSSIAVPTLVLWTSDDPAVDATEGRQIASKIDSAEFTIMAECGHWPQFEDSAKFDEIHLDFLLKPVNLDGVAK